MEPILGQKTPAKGDGAAAGAAATLIKDSSERTFVVDVLECLARGAGARRFLGAVVAAHANS